MANDIESSCTDIDTLDIVTENHECRVIVEGLEKTMTAKLGRDSLWSDKCCIFRVPQVLRRHKPEAYGPDVVSIGPFHRGGKQFQFTEDVKQWYLHKLLSRMNISLQTLIQHISKFEKRAREYYAEPLDHLSQDNFIEMLILDGCFLIELFRKLFCRLSMRLLKKDLVPAELLNINNDPIINMDCMIKYIFHDLMLLENQLPWFVLEFLYSLTLDKEYLNLPLNAIVIAVFSSQASLRGILQFYLDHRHDDDDQDCGGGGGDADDVVDDCSGDEILHILDLVRSATTFRFKKFKSIPGSDVKLPPPASILSEAGIELRKSADCCIMDMDFKDGVFTIPQLSIAESTEPLLRNLIAFEQCCHGRSHKVTSYAILMNSLIVSSKDMDFLRRKDIICNWISSEDASQLFNRLHHDTAVSNFYYDGLCAQVNNYYNVSWNRWPAWLEKLKRDYLSNPWTITSLVAAFILLALTFLQTTYTIQQYYSPGR